MHVYYDESREYDNVRPHPYQPNMEEAAQAGFVDFKAKPEQIALVLEDFRPYDSEAAIQSFYDLLRWLNGPDCELESVDCAFRAPHPNNSTSTSPHAYQADGRLCLMFRHQPANCHAASFDWLLNRLAGELQHLDADLGSTEAVIGFSTAAAIFTEISKTGVRLPDGLFEADDDDPAHGKQVMLWFWCWADDQAAVYANLDRVFRNIWQACRSTSRAITQGNNDARAGRAQ